MRIHSTGIQATNWIGSTIVGKWNKKTYQIINVLGSGATGTVFLAKTEKGQVALKMSENSISISSEVTVFKKLSKVQGLKLGPYLLDIDDFIDKKSNSTIYFYTMEYIIGLPFLEYLQKREKEWMHLFISQLLSQLDLLHKEGYVFGDLKPDNLLICDSPPKVRLLDVGGITQFGRSIKEFTEFFDRGYWELGNRKAEISYDLFSVAMIIINCHYPNKFGKKGYTLNLLKQKIREDKKLIKFETVLVKALTGKYHSAKDMKEEWLNLLNDVRKLNKTTVGKHKDNNQSFDKINATRSSSLNIKTSIKTKKKKNKMFRTLETLLLVVSIVLGYILYLLNQVL
ncbi:MAG: serine/threonine protein kinase [Bacillales bacterium]|jgi:serine/threonine-protein kinase|nr:serine/threonine protein kinase [Bacillales bacterium]